MAGAKLGNQVIVHFVLKDEKGGIYDQTPEDRPETIILGEGDILPGIEVSLVDMKAGETKSVELGPNMHFGERDEKLVFELNKSEFPENITLKEGETLEYGFEDGASALFTIKEIKEDKVTLDGNHPLAGQKISADIKVIDVK